MKHKHISSRLSKPFGFKLNLDNTVSAAENVCNEYSHDTFAYHELTTLLVHIDLLIGFRNNQGCTVLDFSSLTRINY